MLQTVRHAKQARDSIELNILAEISQQQPKQESKLVEALKSKLGKRDRASRDQDIFAPRAIEDMDFEYSSSSSQSDSSEEVMPTKKRTEKAKEKQKAPQREKKEKEHKRDPPLTKPTVAALKDAACFNPSFHETSNTNNADYFIAPACNTRIKETRYTVFNDPRDMMKRLIGPLNADFGSESIGLRKINEKNKYFIIDCKHKGCIYQHWYNY